MWFLYFEKAHNFCQSGSRRNTKMPLHCDRRISVIVTPEMVHSRRKEEYQLCDDIIVCNKWVPTIIRVCMSRGFRPLKLTVGFHHILHHLFCFSVPPPQTRAGTFHLEQLNATVEIFILWRNSPWWGVTAGLHAWTAQDNNFPLKIWELCQKLEKKSHV